MVRRKTSRAVALVLAVAAVAGCFKKDPPVTAPAVVGQPATPDPDPHWVVQQTPPAKIALVYVHGVIGDMIGTWTAPNGKKFFELVDEHQTTKGKADAFVFGFPSEVLDRGSFDIREAANRLHLRLQTQGVLEYPAIVFVAHSMGGLVVLRELLTNRELLEKVPVVVFYATPMEGALISLIGRNLSPNTAIGQMTPADGNALLQTLSDEWNSIPIAKRPHVHCAYESKPLGLAKIVTWSSATRFCEGAPPAIAANHLQIVKPDRPGHDSILVLVAALDKYVLNEELEAKLETPDFTTEGENAVFVLRNSFSREEADLLNVGGTPLRFTLAENSDPTSLLLWPDETKDIQPRGKEELGIALTRAATHNEYHFLIRTSIAPDKKVIVRVPDLQAVRTHQAAIANTVVANIEAALSDPRNARFLSASPDDKDAREAIVQIAHAAIAKEASNLPASAQWVLTADLLNATNWPTLAARALRNAEKASPSATRNPGVQRLAAIVSAQSGDKELFATTATPVASPEAVTAWKVAQPFAQPATSEVATRLASQMQKVPSLKSFGFSLEGDLQQFKGNTEAAHSAFTEAAKIRPTPSVSTRLEKLQYTRTTVVEPRAQLPTPAQNAVANPLATRPTEPNLNIRNQAATVEQSEAAKKRTQRPASPNP
jgi:hypothetical protein